MHLRMRRRSFLKRAAAAFGGISLPLTRAAGVAAAPKPSNSPAPLPYFVLDPEHPCGNAPSGHDCSACHACHTHDANKLFVSAVAADQHRAHPNCRCVVKQGGTLPYGTWTAIFGPDPQPRAVMVDRRDQRVQSILQHLN